MRVEEIFSLIYKPSTDRGPQPGYKSSKKKNEKLAEKIIELGIEFCIIIHLESGVRGEHGLKWEFGVSLNFGISRLQLKSWIFSN